jgi:small subunit ribosomal protein S14
MAKLSIINREKRKLIKSERMRASRQALKQAIKKKDGDFEAQEKALLQLQKRARNESQSRVTSRCRSCGRPRGTFRRFGLCRICLRQAVMRGDVPGMRKASW